MTGRIAHMDLFPYTTPRRGQEEMMVQIEDAVRRGQHMCAEAPNGFGKTCVTLCGVLPWVLENDGAVLYCARTHRQLDRVMEELRAISKGAETTVTGVSFRGRRHMCLNEFVLENAGVVASMSEVCGQLKSSKRCAFYENLKKTDVEEVLYSSETGVLTAPEVVTIAKERRTCPYELAKRIAGHVHVVALSYLYVLDPWIMEAFIPELGTPLSRTVLVQDEAHNVPGTALESASDSLGLGTIRQAMREATTYKDEVSRDLCRGLARAVLDLAANMEDNDEQEADPHAIYHMATDLAGVDEDIDPLSHLMNLGKAIRRGLLRAGKFPRSFVFRVADFLTKWLSLSARDDFTFILTSARPSGGTRRISLDLVALDPTTVTQPVLGAVHSVVAVSGTMSPLKAYSEMIGLREDCVMSVFESPFARKNRLCLIVEGVDTSYDARTSQLFRRMAEHCAAVANATPGNTGVFATSYFVAKSLVRAGLEKLVSKKVFMERQGMKTHENDVMIEEFKSRGQHGGAVLLGVQGGRNSEGGDFPGATMESVVVVGVPYARPTVRTNALIQYYNHRFHGRGRDYAYVLPAMTRAVQAAGRPVRKLDDRAVIVLLDQRFASPYLRRFIPRWLDEVTHVVPDDPDEVGQLVAGFLSQTSTNESVD